MKSHMDKWTMTWKPAFGKVMETVISCQSHSGRSHESTGHGKSNSNSDSNSDSNV